MDIPCIGLSILSVRLSSDGAWFVYDIHIEYFDNTSANYYLKDTNTSSYQHNTNTSNNQLHWIVSHRFSNFLSLADTLWQSGYRGFPSPPQKTFFRPHNSLKLEQRRILLQNWIRSLCQRPDTRTSSAFLNFIQFEKHVGYGIHSLAPSLISLCYDHPSLQLSVNDVISVPSKRYIIAGYTDNFSFNTLSRWGERILASFLNLQQQQPLTSESIDSSSSSSSKYSSNLSSTFVPGIINVWELEENHNYKCRPPISTPPSPPPPNINKNYNVSSPLLSSIHTSDPSLLLSSSNLSQCLGTTTTTTAVTEEQQSITTPTSQTNELNYHFSTSYPLIFNHRSSYTTGSKVQAVYFHVDTNRLFVGLDCGAIRIYYHSINTESKQQRLDKLFVFETELLLHSDSVICIRSNDDYSTLRHHHFVSIGLDNSIQIVNCMTLKNVCGCRIASLAEFLPDEQLTAATIESSSNIYNYMRFFAGTNKGKVYIFNSKSKIPTLLNTFLCSHDEPITAMEIAGRNLLIAHKYALSVFQLAEEEDKDNGSLMCKKIFMPINISGRTIYSIALSKQTPLLFMGHKTDISVWNCITGACVAITKAHRNSISRMHVIEDSDEYIWLLTASVDGYIKLWEYGKAKDYTFWDFHEINNTHHPHSFFNTQQPKQFSHSMIADTCDTFDNHTALSSSSSSEHTINNKENHSDYILKNTNGYYSKYMLSSEEHQIYDDEDDDKCLLIAESATPHRH